MIDASVLLAIMLGEEDAAHWTARINRLKEPFSTPAAIAEVALRLANLYDEPEALLLADIEALLAALRIKVRDLPAACWPQAVHAFTAYGRGRHQAKLNFGDCLAYAAAKHYRVPLFYKGDDFALTDVDDPTGTPPR